jgi:hypothetical protein
VGALLLRRGALALRGGVLALRGGVLALALACTVAGCGGGGGGADGDDPRGGRAGREAVPGDARRATPFELAGRALVDELDCLDCHTLAGQGGTLTDEGGELVAAERAHPERWLRRHLAAPAAALEGRRPDLVAAGAGRHRELWEEELDALLAVVGALDGARAPVLTAPASAVRGGWLFFAHVCVECHTVHGAGGDRGPELTAVATRHDRAWIRTQILEPKRHQPDGDMPAFAGKIDAGELEELLDYLMTLD